MDIEKNNSNEQIREKIEVDIRPQTPKEEFVYLKHLFKRKIFFKEHGYNNVAIPDDEKFKKIWNSKKKEVVDTDLDELWEYFQKNVYNLDFFQTSLERIQEGVKDIDEILARIKNWGGWFKKFKKYEVFLTAYGPGGSYDFQNGGIFMKVNEDGEFWKPPLEIIIHEIVHIGIEEPIVQKYNLEHGEKESLVDAICVKYFSDVLPDYKIQDRSLEEIIELVKENDISNLPEIIEEYKNKK